MENNTKRALLSVSDKTGIVELATALLDAGFELLSTGGTSRFLVDAGLTVTDVSAVTGFPEIMDGRVKTLHPSIFGGILCRRDRNDDIESAERLSIPMIDFVVVNLYPFRETVSRPDVRMEEAIENIDIGGPSLIRAAAKNHQWISVLTAPCQYQAVIEELKSAGETTIETRRRLMREAFRHTASYDATIAGFFASSGTNAGEHSFPDIWELPLQLRDTLRYGENSHQSAAVYESTGYRGPSVVTARQLNGKHLSYNNLLDLDAALGIVRRMREPSVAVLKHNNPCGAAMAEDLVTATRRAFAGDPLSAFGSVVGMNRTVDEETAQWLAETAGLFVEAIVAPDFSDEALKLLTTKPKWKSNVRLLATGPFTEPERQFDVRTVSGGALVQECDNLRDQPESWKVVTGLQPDNNLQRELEFGWSLVRAVKSNAITLSRETSLVGVGAGQMSRVDSVQIAIEKAGERAVGAVLASDAFFPFPDSIELAAKAKIGAIIQPGGSVKDDEVIAAAKQHSIPMIFTGRRHFRH